MDEYVALRLIDEELTRALGAVDAPASLAATVRLRIRERRVSRLPEVLDFIGSLGVLMAASFVALWVAPLISALRLP